MSSSLVPVLKKSLSVEAFQISAFSLETGGYKLDLRDIN